MSTTLLWKYFLEIYKDWNQLIIALGVISVSSIAVIYGIRRFIDSILKIFVKKYNKKYLQAIERCHVTRHLFHSLFVLYLILSCNLTHLNNLLSPFALNIKNISFIIYCAFAFTMLFLSLVNSILDIYKAYFLAERLPISLHMQIVKFFIVSCVTIIVISKILNISPVAIFTSLGAATALLTFIFKDTILGLVASLQLTFQGRIRIGDWVSIPRDKLEGDIIEITITDVKIRISNGATVIIPAYNLLTTNIINWRGIKGFKKRKIKRTIYLKINSIDFCSMVMLENYRKLPYFIETFSKHFEINNLENKMTNIEAFKLYINEYLKNYKIIGQGTLSFLVLELEPTESGSLPIEINVFTEAMEWDDYEKLQSAIYSHLISILPQFKIIIA